jgi:hypothetical protein
MKLQTLASHTIDVNRLPDAPVILDVGCRWFDFTEAVRALRPLTQAICMDPSSDVAEPADTSATAFLRVALVGHDGKTTHFAEGIAGDGAGNLVVEAPNYGDYRVRRVPCMNVTDVREHFCLTDRKFDVVKLDCEGSEFGILENWPGPIAEQISVEWHDCWRPEIRDGDYYERLMRDKLPWYTLVKHDIFQQGNARGHWDDLLILK